METGELPSSPDALRAAAQVLLDLADAFDARPATTGTPTAEMSAPDWNATPPRPSKSPDSRFPMNALAGIARSIYAQRRSRDQEFGIAMSNEPVWDMLLDLFVQRVRGRRISISSMCIASSVPSTTALRYIDLMETHGLIEKSPDPVDRRRTNVEISPSAFMTMARHLDGVLNSIGEQETGPAGMFAHWN